MKTTDIQKCAVLYRTLLNKKFVFTLENNITFNIEFKKENFHHLFGLHKLKDQQLLVINKPQNDASKIYEKILNQDISVRTVESSVHYYKIKNRIEYFDKVFDMLNKDKCKIIIDFDPTKVGNSSLQNTKYILYVETENGYFLFTLGMVRNTKVYPETMFYELSKKYISGQTLLDVYDIKVVEKKK